MTWIFFILELLMFVFALIANKFSHKFNRRYFAFICVLWAIVFGFRAYTIGNDTPAYADFFMGKDSFYGQINQNPDLEIGFLTLVKVIRLFTNSPTVLFTILSTWLFILIYKIYTKVCDDRKCIFVLLVFFIISNSFITLMAATRQSTAFCVLLTGICMLIDYQKFKTNNSSVVKRKCYLFISIGFVLASVLFHKSILFLLLILGICYYVHFTKKQMYIMIFFSFILSIFFINEIGNFFNQVLMLAGSIGFTGANMDVMSIYGSSFGDFNQNFITLLAWAVPVILTIYLSDNDYVNTFFFRVLVLSVCIFLIFNTTFLIERINTLLILLGLTQYLPYNKERNINKYRPIYFIFILLMLVKAGMRYDNWPSSDSTIPYYFFWQK